MLEKVVFALIGVCAVLMVLTFITGSIKKKRKILLSLLALTSIMLLLGEWLFPIYNGDTSSLGVVLARGSKFAAYACTIIVVYIVAKYLEDMLLTEGQLNETPVCIKIATYILTVAIIMLSFSQAVGLYYLFDENNVYQRSSGYFISYVFPSSATVLLEFTTIKYRKKLRRRLFIPLVLFSVMPLASGIVHFFVRKISFTSFFIVGMVVLLYCFTILDSNELANDVHKRELMLISQTTDALVGAIDAKDSYTNGHSKRVAKYSVMIAKEAGKTQEECDTLYLTALLHDVGKIGVPDWIICKKGRLTDEEYEAIKVHPKVGREILSKISASPELVVGASFHHERYDGKGYPFGLKGEEIPEIARIIAVADTYDAMASKRSYRDVLPREQIREEFIKGVGTQFDPKYAAIMIKLIDNDVEYKMREI